MRREALQQALFAAVLTSAQALQDVSGVDPYNPGEDDPGRSRAIESSLWEVESLRNHYCPQVCTAFSVHLP